MRPTTACAQCRAGKRKCDRRAASDGPCSQCMQRNLRCSGANFVANPSLPSSRHLAMQLPPAPSEEEIYLVNLYFQFIHDRPHSIFHEATFKKSVMEGTASRPVVLGMMGMSARFATQPEIRARGASYRAQAMKMLKDVLEHVCIENLQACILVGNNCMGDCEPEAESLYLLLASRMAQLLNLSEVNEADDGVTRELKRQIFWTCFIVDTWVSGGSNVSRHLRWPSNPPRLPMDEWTFASMSPGDADISNEAWSPGLWGHMVELVHIYGQIQEFHAELVNTPQWDEQRMDGTVQRLEADLDAFEQRLNPGLRFTSENLTRFIKSNLGGVFVAFHLGYHHYYTLLYYQYLDQRRPATRNGKRYSERCKVHASIICDVLKASREVPGATALYNIVGHITIVSSSVLLHTYLFGESPDLEDARRRLESNLESLTQLRSYWTSIELMIDRLVVFQKNCIYSMGVDTHRFDKWMVKFLTAHALALEDKIEGYHEPILEGAQVPMNSQQERNRITEDLMLSIKDGNGSYDIVQN